MRQLRITRVQVAAAGLAVAVGILAIFFFMFIKPGLAAIEQTNKQAEDTEQQVRATRPKAEQDLADAKVQEIVVRKGYDKIFQTRMPDISLGDPLAGMFKLWALPKREGPLIAAWFASTGAAVSGYSFPAFGTELPDPNMRVLPPLTWNLSVTEKDFPSFLKWLEQIPKAPRFLVLNSVNLPGMRQPGTPFTATVSVTLYEWVKQERAAAAAAAALATPAATGAAGPGRPGAGRGRGRRAGGRGGQFGG